MMKSAICNDRLNGRCAWYPEADQWQVNDRWYAILCVQNMHPQPPESSAWLTSMHPEDAASLRQSLAALRRGRRNHDELELRVKHAGGHWNWVLLRFWMEHDDDEHRPAFQGMAQDITKCKQHEATLRDDGFFLGQIEQGTGIGTWQVNLVDHQISWSSETCRIHGRRPGYQPGYHEAFNYYSPSARSVVRACIESAQVSGNSFDIELPLNRVDGRRITVRSIGSVDYHNGKAVLISGAIQDVTDTTERLLEQISDRRDELERLNERLSVATNNGGIGIWDLDLNTGQFVWDEQMFKFYGLYETGNRVINAQQWLDFVHRDDRQKLRAALNMARNGDGSNDTDFRIITADGDERQMHTTFRVVRNVTGDPVRLVGTNQDVTQQFTIARELKWRATHDELTGLINRSEFESVLNRLHQSTLNTETEHSLLFIDLDQFKIVNDSCGHAAGDILLRKVSRLLEHTVRSDDVVARLGGDEFAVILNSCNSQESQANAQRICDIMDEFRFAYQSQRFRIGVSIGLVQFSTQWSDVSMIIRAADTACYAAKEAGRNQVHVWGDTDEAIGLRQTQTTWVTRLETALDEDAFELYAQSIGTLNATSAKSAEGKRSDIQAEILLRLKDGPDKLILPSVFMPAAERFNLVNRIDKWVLDSVVAHLLRQDDRSDIGTLWVNLSGQSIEDLRFQRETLDSLKHAGIRVCNSLCLEITETAAVTSLGDAASFIKRLRALGVRVALDDFGAGASSFGYLKNLTVDYLKIDGQFVKNVIEDPLDDAAVRCFTEVARIMGIRSVAEFVETPEVLDRLRVIGVDYVQGWLLHKPVPLNQWLIETAPVVVESAVQD